jgi:hypothetical protein
VIQVVQLYSYANGAPICIEAFTTESTIVELEIYSVALRKQNAKREKLDKDQETERASSRA